MPALPISAAGPGWGDVQFYTQLVEELGHDPLNPHDPSSDDYRAASHRYDEARQALRRLVTFSPTQ